MSAGLQAERTTLAWRRTGLLALVAVLTLLRAAIVRGSPALAAASVLLLLLAGATLSRTSAPADADPPPGDPSAPGLPWQAGATIVVTVVTAALGLVLVVAW